MTGASSPRQCGTRSPTTAPTAPASGFCAVAATQSSLALDAISSRWASALSGRQRGRAPAKSARAMSEAVVLSGCGCWRSTVSSRAAGTGAGRTAIRPSLCSGGYVPLRSVIELEEGVLQDWARNDLPHNGQVAANGSYALTSVSSVRHPMNSGNARAAAGGTCTRALACA